MSNTVAFFSYARQDNDDTSGLLRRVHRKLQQLVRMKTGNSIKIFRDEERIRIGDDWKSEIEAHLEKAHILVPILTPTYYSRDWCRRELEHFLVKGRLVTGAPAVLPVKLVELQRFDAETRSLNDRLVREINQTQHADWTRHLLAQTNRLPKSLVNDINSLAERIAEIFDQISHFEAQSSNSTTTVKKSSRETIGQLHSRRNQIKSQQNQTFTQKQEKRDSKPAATAKQSSKATIDRLHSKRTLSKSQRYEIFTQQLELRLLKSADVFKTLNLALRMNLQNDAVGASTLARELVQMRFEDSVNCLFGAYQNLKMKSNIPAVESLRQVTRLVLPAVVDPDLLKAIETGRCDVNAALVNLNTSSRTIASIVMAALDGRPVSSDYEVPIELADQQLSVGEQFEECFHQHLLNEFISSEDRARKFPVKVLKESIARRLKLRADRGETFYYVFGLADEDFGDPRLEKAVDQLNREYPSIVFVRLCNDHGLYLNDAGLVDPTVELLGIAQG